METITPSYILRQYSILLESITQQRKEGRRLIAGIYGKSRWVPEVLCQHVLGEAAAGTAPAGGLSYIPEEQWRERLTLTPEERALLESYEWLHQSLALASRLKAKFDSQQARGGV